MKRRFPRVKSVPEYTKFRGGLDLVSPALSISSGDIIAGSNYMVDHKGGHSRIDGYERYDGRTSPSDGTYYHCSVTLTGAVSTGDTITGVTSSATGVVVISETDVLIITKVTGTFEAESFTVGGTPKGTIDSVPTYNGEVTAYRHAVALNAVADEYRGDILAPTGSGPIRGIKVLKGILYCFRDNAGATAGLIYKATSAGWSAVSLGSEIEFDTGSGLISDGDTITGAVSSATAVVQRVVLESGAWADGDAAGRLIIGTVTGGPFQAENLTVTGVEAVATGAESAITILPGGRYDMVVSNFYASEDRRRIYGCDGVNRGFEFDGTVYVPINTGMDTDTPTHVSVNQYQLCFSFYGSHQQSSIGNPYSWEPLTGADEIGLGDHITGYLHLPGEALAMFSRNMTYQLLGNTADGYTLDTISDEVGAIEWTNQRIGHAYCLDDRGVIKVEPTNKFGNFEQNTISRKVQPLIDLVREKAQASVTYKTRNQYRIYCDDGLGVCMTLTDSGYEFSKFQYPDNVYCATSGEDSDGKDVIFFGSDEGMVYQADKGSSFDGDEIEAFFMTAFNHSKSPTVLKTYQQAVIEMTATGYAAIRFHPDFSYSSSEISTHRLEWVTVQGGGAFWDVENWGEFYYDTAVVDNPGFTLDGHGVNMSLIAYSKSDIDLGHRIEGAVIHYIPRKLNR